MLVLALETFLLALDGVEVLAAVGLKGSEERAVLAQNGSYRVVLPLTCRVACAAYSRR